MSAIDPSDAVMSALLLGTTLALLVFLFTL